MKMERLDQLVDMLFNLVVFASGFVFGVLVQGAP